MLYDDVCIWCSSVFLCEAEMFVYKTLDPTIFGVIDQLYLDYLFSRHDGTEVWIYIWWCHVLTWPFLEVFDQYCFGILSSRFWGPKCIVIHLRCFWMLLEKMDIVSYFEMHFGCSLRTNAYYDLFWDISWLLDGIWWFIIYMDNAIFIDAFSC